MARIIAGTIIMTLGVLYALGVLIAGLTEHQEDLPVIVPVATLIIVASVSIGILLIRFGRRARRLAKPLNTLTSIPFHLRGPTFWTWPAAFFMGLYALRHGIWWPFCRAIWTSRWTWGMFMFCGVLAAVIVSSPGGDAETAAGICFGAVIIYVFMFCGLTLGQLRYKFHGVLPPTCLTPDLPWITDEQRDRIRELESDGKLWLWNWQAAFLLGIWALRRGLWKKSFKLLWSKRASWIVAIPAVALAFALESYHPALIVVWAYVAVFFGREANRVVFVFDGKRLADAAAEASEQVRGVGVYLLVWAAIDALLASQYYARNTLWGSLALFVLGGLLIWRPRKTILPCIVALTVPCFCLFLALSFDSGFLRAVAYSLRSAPIAYIVTGWHPLTILLSPILLSFVLYDAFKKYTTGEVHHVVP